MMKAEVVRVGANGRIVIPAAVRRALGVDAGDALLLRVVDGELRLLPRRRAVRMAQALVARHVPRERSLVEALLKTRREEVARDRRGGRRRS